MDERKIGWISVGVMQMILDFELCLQAIGSIQLSQIFFRYTEAGKVSVMYLPNQEIVQFEDRTS